MYSDLTWTGFVGNEVPDDPVFRTVFPDPNAAADMFWRKHGFVPVNHMLTVRRDLAQDHPDIFPEVVRLFRESKDAVAASNPDGRDPLVFGRAALDPAIRLALRYSTEQGLLPRKMDIEDIWEGLPAGV